MYHLKAYIPVSDTAIYEFRKKMYAIAAPFQKFSITELPVDFDIQNCPAVLVDVKFRVFEDLKSHLKMWHTYEILSNDKIVELWKNQQASQDLNRKEKRKQNKRKIIIAKSRHPSRLRVTNFQ